MGNRVIVLYCVMILLFGTLIFRIYYITQSDYLTQASNNQSSYSLDITTTRGEIYDCNMKPLIDTETKNIAAIMPCSEAINNIAANVVGEQRNIALERMKKPTPFLIELDRSKLYSQGINMFNITNRYSDNQLAPHIIGYKDNSTGDGVCGIELSCNDLLKSLGEDVKINYTVDAFKQPIISILPEITGDTAPPKGGIVTTLDKDIQQVAANAAMEMMISGAVVIMEAQTGELKAVVSMPQFNPNNIEKAMQEENSPLFNRAFGAYSVGSTFKLAVAATALKEGIDTEFAFFCPGYIEVNGIKFSCHKKEGHGWLTMEGAIEQSCNPYFVALAQQLDPQNLLYTVSEMGFGKASKLGEKMITEAGTLYTATELQNKANLANFSFGQGKLTATPIQVAQMVSCIANGGNTVLPSLIKGITSNGETITEPKETFVQNKLLSKTQAKILQDYMINVVENGSGKKGKPENGGAGGKTASAQTGQYTDDREKVEAWFAGFFPANEPKYTVVVFVEGGEYGGDVAGPIFKAIADGINTVEKKRFS